MKRLVAGTLLLGAFLMLSAFNLDNSIGPKEDILSGGPLKDGIPAILQPRFIKANESHFLKDEDQVMGVEVGGQSRAYPINILNWHEVVNDTITGEPVVVTF
ncbi:MAG: DUF3179 domain-containing protein [Deltaproteobacteria bacterium]|nr:MAG: DUF3179 domain-containing protein [Deltaproteobacteria bacterium]